MFKKFGVHNYNFEEIITDINWHFKTIDFEGSTNMLPVVSVSVGSYYNKEFFNYWGIEVSVLNVTPSGCMIRYKVGDLHTEGLFKLDVHVAYRY